MRDLDRDFIDLWNVWDSIQNCSRTHKVLNLILIFKIKKQTSPASLLLVFSCLVFILESGSIYFFIIPREAKSFLLINVFRPFFFFLERELEGWFRNALKLRTCLPNHQVSHVPLFGLCFLETCHLPQCHNGKWKQMTDVSLQKTQSVKPFVLEEVGSGLDLVNEERASGMWGPLSLA